MVFEFHEGAGFQSPGTFKNLYISNIPDNLDHLSHQSLVSKLDKANLILRYRSVNDEGHHIGNNATNSSFCCHIILVILFYLNSAGICTSSFNASIMLRKS